jgi:type II restriction enzyme
LTKWGGNVSPVQRHDNTGAIWLFSVIRVDDQLQAICWVAEDPAEEIEIESWVGCEVEPKFTYSSIVEIPNEEIKWELPDEWFQTFPTGAEIFSKVVQLCPRTNWVKSIDDMLLHRRKLEFEIFQHLEISHVLPRVKNGFTTVDEFVRLANSVTNRRKSRAGTSLELNLESIFRDEQLRFDTQKITEGKKKPDFLFPGQREYRDPTFPDLRLYMLAAKTCCKDRWRQATTEAKRISPKHLFTLQEGVSEHQLEEMKASMVKLVVPSSHVSKFPKAWQNEIMTLKSFVDFVRLSQNAK